MRINKKILLFVYILLFLCQIIFSQRNNSKQDNINSKVQVAYKYYSEKDFEKASVLFKEVYEITNYKAYRDLYIRSMFELKEFKQTEEYLKKELRKKSSDFFLKIDIGMALVQQNLNEDADKYFNEVINLAKKDKNNVIAVANSFVSYRQYDYAIKMYSSGQKELSINFDYELGTLFYIQRDYKSMMEKYCSILIEGNEIILSNIQNQLQYILATDIDDNISETIEITVLKELQRYPSSINLIKLLFWQYSQTGKNKLALNQLIALDKRTGKNDKDILDFAIILKNNNEFNIALEATNYIINKGDKNDYYSLAFIEAADIKYKSIIGKKNISLATYQEIETDLSKEISNFPKQKTYNINYNLIVLKAYYLHKYNEAIALADTLIKENYYSKEQNDELRLLLGDIYLISGNQWDATLCYAKVENTAKETIIGHEARYKKAKLAYYIGQFKWAQTQLNVLKASTSKLIANDALELSIFISENYDLDTTETTMRIFASADFLLFSKNYEKALITLDSIFDIFTGSSLIDDALYRKAFIKEEQGQIQQASEIYKNIFTEYYFDILADNALFRYAILQNNLKNYDEADNALFKLISEYPSSIFSNEARNIMRTKGTEKKTITKEIDFWNTNNYSN